MRRTKTTPQVRLENVPRFRNEAEEAAWWDAHPEVIVQAFEQAYGKKAIQRVIGASRKPKRPPTQTVTMRLPVDDVARAKRMATRKGLGYQTLVKSLLHEALLRIPQFTIIEVHGDAKTMQVRSFVVKHHGRPPQDVSGSLDDLKARVRAWFDWADRQVAAA